jgi:PEP-CTERM motif
MRFSTGLAFILAAAAALPAQAATTISSAYTRVSSVEALTALFLNPTGATSTNSYSGPVEVLVSGTGFSLGNVVNDAFYFTSGQSPLAGNYYHLGFNTTGVALTSPATQSIEQSIAFIEGVGAVGPGTIPAYAANNTYNFVIDSGALSKKLTFGVLDGVFSDNGGQYNIQIWQLRKGAAGAVPEAGTWMMMIVGFGAAGAAMRRRLSIAAIA